MSNWLYLGPTIFSVLATSFLKSSEGFTKLWPSIIVLVGYMLAFYFLSLTLDTIPLGIAYAVWSGVELPQLRLFRFFAFDQKIDLSAVIGIGLIIIDNCSKGLQ